MPAECDQVPATPVTAAAGFSSLIRRKSAARVVRLVQHDLVGRAPEHLQGHAREGDRARVVDRTAARVGDGHALRNTAYLTPSQLLKRTAVGEARKVAIPPREIRRRIESDCPCEEGVEASNEQERLLAAMLPPTA